MKKTTSRQVKKRRIRRGIMMAASALCLVIGFGGKAYAGSTTASKRGSNLKKAVTYHAATYTNGAFLEDFNKQIIYTVTR